MKRMLLAFLLAVPVQVFGQLAVVSTTPANLATNVSLITTFSVAVNTVLDTVMLDENFDKWVATNVDSAGPLLFGADGKSFSATLYLQPNATYFFGILTLKAKDGSWLGTPFGIHFTTGASLPTTSISGTISSGTTGVAPENAFVGLSTTNFTNSGNDGPTFGGIGIVNADGTFSIPYIPNGTYWPLAAKDADGDGSIDPNNGTDVLAIGDSVVVNNASVTGLSLTFVRFSRLTCAESITIADSIARSLPADRLLKSIQGYDVDTLGKSSEWTFTYVINSGTEAREVRASSFVSQIDVVTDPGYLGGLIATHTLTSPDLAASSSVVMANAEGQGGKAFRTQSVPDSLTFRMQMQLGDLSNSNFWELSPNPSLYYWGVLYSFGVESPNNWFEYKTKKFLCDFTTGTILGATNVAKDGAPVPSVFALSQNYPNPFNPSTVIGYELPKSGYVTLRVFDLLGREVATLVNGTVGAGSHKVEWNASGLPSGVYCYRLESGTLSETRKLVLLK